MQGIEALQVSELEMQGVQVLMHSSQIVKRATSLNLSIKIFKESNKNYCEFNIDLVDGCIKPWAQFT